MKLECLVGSRMTAKQSRKRWCSILVCSQGVQLHYFALVKGGTKRMSLTGFSQVSGPKTKCEKTGESAPLRAEAKKNFRVAG